MKVEIKLLDKRLKMSDVAYATDGSAAFDLRACITAEWARENGLTTYYDQLSNEFASVDIPPGEVVFVPSGIALSIPRDDVALFALPRSGKGAKEGCVLANGTGLIDSDYQKEIMIPVWNRSDKPFEINVLERICQAVFLPVIKANFLEVDEFSRDSSRGGFGSTGKG